MALTGHRIGGPKTSGPRQRPRIAALSGSQAKAPGFAGGYLLDRNNLQHRIRLSQIDAPEIGHGKRNPGQPFSKASKQSLSDLIYGREVRADCETKDKYGRQVCAIWMGQMDVNLEQVRRGMAWVYRKYARDPSYYQAEEEARRTGRGLWSHTDAIPPWEWRHR